MGLQQKDLGKQECRKLKLSYHLFTTFFLCCCEVDVTPVWSVIRSKIDLD